MVVVGNKVVNPPRINELLRNLVDYVSIFLHI